MHFLVEWGFRFGSYMYRGKERVDETKEKNLQISGLERLVFVLVGVGCI